jgi:hypothetical protein
LRVWSKGGRTTTLAQGGGSATPNSRPGHGLRSSHPLGQALKKTFEGLVTPRRSTPWAWGIFEESKIILFIESRNIFFPKKKKKCAKTRRHTCACSPSIAPGIRWRAFRPMPGSESERSPRFRCSGHRVFFQRGGGYGQRRRRG